MPVAAALRMLPATKERDPSGLQRSILSVIEAHFPSLLAGTNTTVSALPPESFLPRATFNSDTREIKLADFYGSGGNTATPKGAQFTTADVMDAVNIILHEASHAQRKRPASPYFKDIPSTDKEKAAKIGAGDNFSYLYSIGPKQLMPEELLANAYAISQMKERGMIVEGSMTAAQATLLDKMFKEVPALKTATNQALQESVKAPNSITSQIQELITGLLK